jgi:acyl-CoA synthetase (AMP-forming)/AMP-acid ligase II
MHLPLLLEMAASVDPDRVAFTSGRSQLTASELQVRAANLEATIHGSGAEHLAYIGTNGLAFPIAIFGAAAAAVPVLPINYRLSQDRQVAMLARHSNTLVVAPKERVADLASAGFAAISLSEVVGSPLLEIEAGPDPDPDDIAVLLYTSGTTAEPKAVVLRHRHLAAYVMGTVEFASAESSDAALVAVPPYHVAGVAHVLTNLYAGRRVVYLESFDPAAWIGVVEAERITNAMVVPTMLSRVVDVLESDGAQLESLRTLVYGGAKMPPDVLQRALGLLPNVDFVNAYGLTETSSTIAVLGPEDHRRALVKSDACAVARLRSVGKIVPGVELEVRGPDGVAVATGENGEIFVRGPQVSGEYLGRLRADEDGGWFATRDSGRIDADGYLFIDGRSDDTIIRGGENIAPAEIEDVLAQHPAVRDCAVVGIADEEWGQRTVAFVVCDANAPAVAEELRAFVRAELRGSRTPDQIEFRTNLPYTETGKVLRRALQAELEGEPR